MCDQHKHFATFPCAEKNTETQCTPKWVIIEGKGSYWGVKKKKEKLCKTHFFGELFDELLSGSYSIGIIKLRLSLFV